MKVFVINLDRAPERLHRMSGILDDIGMAFCRVTAVDGRTLPAEEIARWRSGNPPPGGFRAGETACFLSHRKCWQRVVDEGLALAVILEDDLHFGKDATSLFGSDRWVPPDADIIKLETKFYHTSIEKSPSATIGMRSLFRLRGKHAGAGAYIVTRKGAESLLSMSRKFNDPVDQFIFNPELPSGASLKIYQLLPAVCVQDFVVKKGRLQVGLGSDLHFERSGEKASGVRKLWREAKRPFGQLFGHLQRAASGTMGDRKLVSVPFE